MLKEIRAHQRLLKNSFSKEMSASEREVLAKLHYHRLRSFQHERLIHLLITLFFAGLALVSGIISFWLFINLLGAVAYLSLALFMIVLVLELAYVRHYYYLENSIQELYQWDEQLMLRKNH
ncbi:MAG: hypothetical protein ACOX0Z_00285 [Candidatus Nanosyncoccaceae bacterium]|jgi:Flp pilus assembly protein TadB